MEQEKSNSQKQIQLLQAQLEEMEQYKNELLAANQQMRAQEEKLLDINARLHESESKFRSYVENANDIIYQISPEGIFTFASSNWTEILGYPINEVEGKEVKDFVHPEDIDSCISYLSKVLQTKEKQGRIEYRVKHKNGNYRWHESKGSPLFDEQGEVYAYMGIARDITDYKQEREKLDLLNQRYQSIVSKMPNGAVFIFDENMVYRHVDGSELAKVGLAPEQFIGKTVVDVFPPEVHVTALANQQKLLKGESCYYEVSFAGNFYANWGIPIFDHAGNFVEGIIYAFNITQLKNQEEYFRLLFDNSAIGIGYYTLEGKLISFNEKALENMGGKLEDYQHKSVLEIFGEEQGKEYLRRIQACINQEENLIFEDTLELAGGSKSYRSTYNKVFDPKGNLAGVQITSDDISDLLLAEQQLRISENRFRTIYEHLNVGLAIVSLDFHIQRANPAYCEMLGYSEDELMGVHLAEITSKEIVEENLKKQKQLAAGEIDFYRMEKQFIHKNGQLIYGILDANLIRDLKGKPLYCIGSVLDITKRKVMELELRKNEESLKLALEKAQEATD